MAEPRTDPDKPRLRSLPYVNELLVAEFASSAGSTMALLGIAYLSYDDSGSVLHTVLVSAAYSLPMAVFGMYAGRLTQKVSRRKLLLVAYSIKMAIYLVLGGLAAAGMLKVPGLMVASLLAGITAAFTSPAWMEFERDILPVDRLAEANGAFGSASAAAGLVGSLVGGTLMGLIGVWSVFVMDALSYLPFQWVLFRARVTEHLVEAPRHVSVRQTFQHVRAKPLLWRAFGRIALLSLLVAPVAQLLPAIAANISTAQWALGVLTAVFGLGAVSVAWVITRLQKRFPPHRIVDICFAASAAVLVLFGLFGDPLEPPAIWGLAVASLIPLGLVLTLAQSVIAAVVQVRVDPDMEGPVFALYAVIYTVVAPIGGILLGQVADHSDVWTALVVAGICMFVLTLVLVVLLRRHPADSEPDRGDGGQPGGRHLHPSRLRLHLVQSGSFPLSRHHPR